MNPAITFRILLVTSIILGITGAIAEFTTVALLPEPLERYSTMDMNSEATATDLVGALISIPALGLMLAGYTGLFLLKRWGRTLFLAALIIIYPSSLLLGPFVFTGISYLFYELATLATGMILAMAYFSPVKDLLDKPRARQATPIP